MKKIATLSAVLSVAALLLGAAALGAWLLYRSASSPLLIEPAQVISVQPGTRTLDVARTLESRGVVSNARVLALLAKFRGLDTEVRHGEHLFSGWMTPGMVLEELVRPPQRPGLRVTIPEGLRIEEIGDLLERGGLASSSDYRNSVC